jgi:anti-sigma B factor antagonist
VLRTATTNGQVPRQRRKTQDGDVYRGSIDLTLNRPAPDVVVLDVGGEVDMLTAPELRRAVAEQVHPRPRVLVIDLRAVTFLGASGLAVLLEIHDAAARTATSVRLVCDTQVVTRPLEILGLREMFEVFTGLHAALAGVRPHPGPV